MWRIQHWTERNGIFWRFFRRAIIVTFPCFPCSLSIYRDCCFWRGQNGKSRTESFAQVSARLGGLEEKSLILLPAQLHRYLTTEIGPIGIAGIDRVNARDVFSIVLLIAGRHCRSVDLLKRHK